MGHLCSVLKDSEIICSGDVPQREINGPGVSVLIDML